VKLQLDDKSVEIWVGYVLRAGVIVSAGLFLLGTAFGGANLSLEFPHRVSTVLAGVERGDPQAIIGLGLLTLIATPWIMVTLSLAMFLHLRDWVYSLVCFFVLVTLTASLFLGTAGQPPGH
jgi:uncharacterized membrane protein